ncbi:hypothetical protein V6N11_040002 [Hibiscus sabdariffa]|uniref:Eukaryotic translation initiation factor 3 subunit M n=1 Tax=Hibiscus sabdariffa TaxID=183260 RepID=A0ABR2RGE2_9ROSI
MTTVVPTSEEDPVLPVVRFTAELSWADAGPEVAEPHVTRLCMEAQECMVRGRWLDLASLMLTSAEIVFSKVSDKDLECIFTVICNLVSRLENPNEELEVAKLISTKITQQPTDKPAMRLKILFNLYNLLEGPDSRFFVYMQALNLALNGTVSDHIVPSFKKIDSFLKDWNIGVKDQRNLFLAIANVLKENKSSGKDSFKFLTKYLATFSDEDSYVMSEAKDEAVRAIIEFVKAPDTFQCDLLDMPAVGQLEKDAKYALVYQLLKIFLTQRLDAYLEFQAANSTLLKSLVHEDCITKMRLMSLVDLGCSESGQIPYALIKDTLRINDDEVELWVVKAITAKLIECKMDQMNQVVIVSRCTECLFGQQQWHSLRSKLATWRGNVASLISTIQANKVVEEGSQGMAIRWDTELLEGILFLHDVARILRALLGLSCPSKGSCGIFCEAFCRQILTSAQIYTPVENIALDCGSSTSGNSAAPDGRQWTGDKDSPFAVIDGSGSRSVSASVQTHNSSFHQVPYMTARISKSEFTYMFPVTAGQKFIRLYFDPARYHGFDTSVYFFSVKVGPYMFLNNFTASFPAEQSRQASSIKEFCVNLMHNQTLNVTFTPSTVDSYAFVNGIEIVSMPTNLYYHSSLDHTGVPIIGQNAHFSIDNYTALQNVHRLNVGGPSISATNDTGMYRNWYNDIDYLVGGGVVPSNTSIKLEYDKIPEYSAPDNVYTTARSMGRNRTENLLYNLTWRLPVDSGFRYLVRLHFCEFDPSVKGTSDRRFRIFIDNKTADSAFSVIDEAGGNGKPTYMDYVVMIGNFNDKSEHSLFIALHPNDEFSGYTDAILNGLEVFKLNNSDGNLARPNSLPDPSTEGTERASPKADKSKLLFSIGFGGIGLFIVLVLLCSIIIWRHRKMKQNGSHYKPSCFCCFVDSYKGDSSAGAKNSSLPDELCRRFLLDEIKAATSDFHEALIIGVGGFGNVYKGFLDDGETIVAIKRLNPESKQGAQEFKTEIEMLSQLRHIHLVSLIGYCNDNNEMILVYDYMINGTLCNHLYDTTNDPLTWKQRLKICHGAAIGLNYLHTEVKYTVIHRDVKTSNILLDHKFTAKVSDFGLSKLDPKIDMVNTGVKGTWGYLDPEYARGHSLTEKSDVYSFGVVLFEVLCARKALDKRLSVEQMNLAHWVKKCIADGTLYQAIDPRLKGKIAPECLKVFVEIAESCIQDLGVKRPLMNDVMERLGFALELQESADSELVENNHGNDHSYPDIVFPVHHRINVDSEALDSDVIAVHTPIPESGSFVSSDMLSNTFKG